MHVLVNYPNPMNLGEELKIELQFIDDKLTADIKTLPKVKQIKWHMNLSLTRTSLLFYLQFLILTSLVRIHQHRRSVPLPGKIC